MPNKSHTSSHFQWGKCLWFYQVHWCLLRPYQNVLIGLHHPMYPQHLALACLWGLHSLQPPIVVLWIVLKAVSQQKKTPSQVNFWNGKMFCKSSFYYLFIYLFVFLLLFHLRIWKAQHLSWKRLQAIMTYRPTPTPPHQCKMLLFGSMRVSDFPFSAPMASHQALLSPGESVKCVGGIYSCGRLRSNTSVFKKKLSLMVIRW